MVECIGVGKYQPIARSMRRSMMKRIAFSQPAGTALASLNDLYAWMFCGQLFDDLRGAVSGAVVNHNYFEVRIVLSGKRFQASGDLSFFIPDWNYNANRRKL